VIKHGILTIKGEISLIKKYIQGEEIL